MTLLAKLAQAEWDQRLAFAKREVAARRWSPVEAEARLMPWLAVALLAGAEPAEAAAELEDLRRHDPHGRTHARAILADRLCPAPDMRAELLRARDAALKAALAKPGDRPGSSSEAIARDRAACDRSARLQYLAVFLGAPQSPSSRTHSDPLGGIL